jgi:hypothetical protein
VKDVPDNIQFALKPYNGLGNRFRAVATGIVLAKFLNAKLLLYWTSTRGFDETKLQDLIDFENFSKKYGIKLIDQSEWNSTRKNSRKLDKLFSNIHESSNMTAKTDVDTSHENNKSNYIKEMFSGKWKTISCKTSANLFNIFGDDMITTAPNIWQEFESVCKDMGVSEVVKQCAEPTLNKIFDQTFSIHMRRGDAVNTDFYEEHHAKYSVDVVAYINRARELLKSGQYDNFFLATDCKKTKDVLADIFGNRLITYDKEFGKSVWHEEKPGQLVARVEQYILSKTKFMLTSEWSTFSDFARIVGDIKTEVVGQDQTKT